MKQIFYGPTGDGKSHLILHGLANSKKLVVVTTNFSVEQEFSFVGLNDIEINTIPFIIKDSGPGYYPSIIIDADEAELQKDCIIGFRLGIFETSRIRNMVFYKVIEWLQETGISENPDYTIVFIALGTEITNPLFITEIEKWKADIIIEHTIDEFSIEHSDELKEIQKSGTWFEIPILNKTYTQK